MESTTMKPYITKLLTKEARYYCANGEVFNLLEPRAAPPSRLGNVQYHATIENFAHPRSMPKRSSHVLAIIILVLVTSIVLGILGHVYGQCYASGAMIYAWFVVVSGALVLATGEFDWACSCSSISWAWFRQVRLS